MLIFLYISLSVILISCHENDDGVNPLAPPPTTSRVTEPSQLDKLRSLSSIVRTQLADVIKISGDLIDLWNSTRDKDSAIRRLDQIDEKTLKIKNDLAEIQRLSENNNYTLCGYDLLNKINSNIAGMSYSFRRFLTSEKTSDLVSANENLFSARSALQQYVNICQ